MISANDLKAKGVACLEESLTDKMEDVITVHGKECYVCAATVRCRAWFGRERQLRGEKL